MKLIFYPIKLVVVTVAFVVFGSLFLLGTFLFERRLKRNYEDNFGNSAIN